MTNENIGVGFASWKIGRCQLESCAEHFANIANQGSCLHALGIGL